MSLLYHLENDESSSAVKFLLKNFIKIKNEKAPPASEKCGSEAGGVSMVVCQAISTSTFTVEPGLATGTVWPEIGEPSTVREILPFSPPARL